MKAAIFDVDGTLLDSMPIWKDAGARYLKTQGIDAEEGLSDVLWNMSIPEGASYMKMSYSLTCSADEIVNGIVAVVRDFYYKEVCLKPGAMEFLQELSHRKIPMVVATSSDRSYLQAAFQRNGIDGFFRKIFTCEEVGAGKTNPKIYLEASAYLKLPPEDIWVFEDALYAVETAKKAGFQVVGIYDECSKEHEEAIQKQSDLYWRDFTERMQL